MCVHVQGGIESEEDYPYCSGFGKCFPCAAPGYNKTRCGPAAPYCLKNESCSFKLERSKFVPGLNLSSWVAISKVHIILTRRTASLQCVCVRVLMPVAVYNILYRMRLRCRHSLWLGVLSALPSTQPRSSSTTMACGTHYCVTLTRWTMVRESLQLQYTLYLPLFVLLSAVLLVGYGTHKSLFGTKPYWLVKNRCVDL